MFDFILRPFGWLLEVFYDMTGSFVAAVFIFTVIVNVVQIPLKIKQQKGMAAQSRLKPKADALREKYKDDKMKYNQAYQELMAKEKINPLGGCLPMVIQLPLVMLIYSVVTNPMTHILNLSKDVIMRAKEAALPALQAIDIKKFADVSKVRELDVIGNWPSGVEGLGEKLNFNFLGLDLSQTPHFSLDFSKAEWIWIVPFIALAGAMFSSVVSIMMTKKTNPGANNPVAMMLGMPLISLFFAFNVAGAVGLYWAMSSVINGLLQAVIQYFYNANRLLAIDEEKLAQKRRFAEKAKIEKRNLES